VCCITVDVCGHYLDAWLIAACKTLYHTRLLLLKQIISPLSINRKLYFGCRTTFILTTFCFGFFVFYLDAVKYLCLWHKTADVFFHTVIFVLLFVGISTLNDFLLFQFFSIYFLICLSFQLVFSSRLSSLPLLDFFLVNLTHPHCFFLFHLSFFYFSALD